MSGLDRNKSIIALIAAAATGIAPLFLRWSVSEVLLSLALFSAALVGIIENLPGERLHGRLFRGLPGWLSVRTLAYGALFVLSLCVIVSAALSRA